MQLIHIIIICFRVLHFVVVKDAAYILAIEGTYDNYKHGGKQSFLGNIIYPTLYESGKLAISACILAFALTHGRSILNWSG